MPFLFISSKSRDYEYILKDRDPVGISAGRSGFDTTSPTPDERLMSHARLIQQCGTPRARVHGPVCSEELLDVGRFLVGTDMTHHNSQHAWLACETCHPRRVFQ